MKTEEGQVKTVQCLSPKEMKALARPEFEKNYQLYYPVKTFEKIGFSRAQCPKCHHYYWRKSEKASTCGDSNCLEKYNFIGKGTGIGKEGVKLTYEDAWKGFAKSLTTARIPCTEIKRYPVVARWRNDVDFTAAGIYCFQPYCVTGEMDAPANPLICPQFCVRFNDLDNIGITGRHYSGFVMIGIQVFNLPGKYVFFKDECTEFNYRWLTETLKIDPEEITFTEDVWCGGGNLGPSIEYFVGGLEIGNMVFMQFKTSHDGKLSDLPVKVIDVGIGLERIPWVINGTPSSYVDTFAEAYDYLKTTLGITEHNDVWEKFGPYSCQLNVDDAEDIDKTWAEIAAKIGMETGKVKEAIAPIRDMYIVLDHTRTIMMIIQDGALPSNVGGGGNVRNVLRRVFSILSKNGWWEKLKMEGLMKLFEMHRKKLSKLYGEFPEHKSFPKIIQVEYDRWLTTDDVQQKNLEKLLKKNKGKLSLDDWIVAVTSWGIPDDRVAAISGLPIPPNLYHEIAARQDKVAKVAEEILYDTAHLPATENLYYKDHRMTEFTGKIIEIFENKQENMARNIVILDRSAFYPFSGGQLNDLGQITIEGEVYELKDCQRIGKAVLHFLDKPLPKEKSHYMGMEVSCKLDEKRRTQLRWHHTATHVMYAASRKVLGPHVWQQGAKKTPVEAHLDISHYQSLTPEEEYQIESTANDIVRKCVPIKKYMMNKAEAEKAYGFLLYQGGAIPGNELRIVNIEGVDVEACCGTHCDNTGEIGFIKLLKTQRISDGVVRLTFVAGDRAYEELKVKNSILNQLCEMWGIEESMILKTAERFFKDYKRLTNETKEQDKRLLSYQVQLALCQPELKVALVMSDQADPTLYFSNLSSFAPQLKDSKRGIVFLGDKFVIGLLGDPTVFDPKVLNQFIVIENGDAKEEKTGETKAEDKKKVETKEGVTKCVTKDGKKGEAKEEKKGEAKGKKKQTEIRTQDNLMAEVGKKKVKVTGICQFSYAGNLNKEAIKGVFEKAGFITL